ncbi:hypothetical protein EV122DRAFT_273652 [Schizophyllum commune]
MGSFEGRCLDELHPYLQEHLAILFSRECIYDDARVAKFTNPHLHSTPDWVHPRGKLQYIVPILHRIDLHDIDMRWAIDSRRSAGNDDLEGHYMNMDNLLELRTHAKGMYGSLKEQCKDRVYRQKLRQVLREKWTVDGPPPARNPNCSNPSIKTHHSRAPSVVLEPIPENPTTASHTRPTAPTPYKAENSWISTRKFSVSSTSSRSTASKRRSVYDDECPRTPKAAKQEFDTSSTHSRGSKRLFPFMKSSRLLPYRVD